MIYLVHPKAASFGKHLKSEIVKDANGFEWQFIYKVEGEYLVYLGPKYFMQEHFKLFVYGNDPEKYYMIKNTGAFKIEPNTVQACDVEDEDTALIWLELENMLKRRYDQKNEITPFEATLNVGYKLR